MIRRGVEWLSVACRRCHAGWWGPITDPKSCPKLCPRCGHATVITGQVLAVDV